MYNIPPTGIMWWYYQVTIIASWYISCLITRCTCRHSELTITCRIILLPAVKVNCPYFIIVRKQPELSCVECPCFQQGHLKSIRQYHFGKWRLENTVTKPTFVVIALAPSRRALDLKLVYLDWPLSRHALLAQANSWFKLWNL